MIITSSESNFNILISRSKSKYKNILEYVGSFPFKTVFSTITLITLPF